MKGASLGGHATAPRPPRPFSPSRSITTKPGFADLGEVDLSVPGLLQATTLARQACDEVFYLGSASAARELAQRALAAGLPLDV
jgi:hypothetical protein